MSDGGTSSMLSYNSAPGIGPDSRRYDSFVSDAGLWNYSITPRTFTPSSPTACLTPSSIGLLPKARSQQQPINLSLELSSSSSALSPKASSGFGLPRFNSSPSPPREGDEKSSEGDFARVEHDQIIYGALLEECLDHRMCTGIPAGCLKAHPWNAWQTVRRDPRHFNYGSKLCSFFAEGSCQKGDQCSFAHSKTEVQFHPKVYKTQACNRFSGSRYCGNKLCAFYHIFDDGSDDSRKPPDAALDNISPGTSFALEENVWLDRAPIASAVIQNSLSSPASPKLNRPPSIIPRSFPSLGHSSSFGGLPDPSASNLWKPMKKRTLERSTSEMKFPERRSFTDPNLESLKRTLTRERSATPPLPSTLTDCTLMSPQEAARYHWSIEHLDLKMKNPNRKESQFGLNLLAWVPDFPLRELIKTLCDESWTVEQLRSYLSHTLVRALEEKKVVLNENGKFSGFNTGLVPPSASYSMIAVLTYSPVQQGTKFEWTLTHFKSPMDVTASKTLPVIPSPVCYMDGKSDMWFDTNKHILPFGDQLLGRVIDRIAEVRPDIVSYDVFIQMAVLEKAMKNAEKNVNLNPNCAVPSFYRPKGQLHGSVQFLLPISFTDETTRIDGALAVQERSQGYVACTVLSLQDAYAHARLIGKPTAGWLSSICAAEGDSRPVGSPSLTPAGRLLLDHSGGIEITYQDQSIPRVFVTSADEKLLDREVHNEIIEYFRKLGFKQILMKTNQNLGRLEWEIGLNIPDFMALLQKCGKSSSLESFSEHVISL